MSDSPYHDITCEKCGSDYFELPLEGMTARKKFAYCLDCGHKQFLKPGDMMKTEFAREKGK